MLNMLIFSFTCFFQLVLNTNLIVEYMQSIQTSQIEIKKIPFLITDKDIFTSLLSQESIVVPVIQ